MGSSPNRRINSTASEQQVAGGANSQQRHSDISSGIKQWMTEARQDPANAAKIEKDREAWRIQTAELEARERSQNQGQGMVFPNIPYSPREDAPNFRGNAAAPNQPTTPGAQGAQPETSRPRRFSRVRLANPRRFFRR
jgi:hypothetical protein